MEDGNCHQVKKDNTTSESLDAKSSYKRSDNCLSINGGTDKPLKNAKSNFPYNDIFTSGDDCKISAVPDSFNKQNNINSNDATFKKVPPKIPRPIITKHSSFKRILKRTTEDTKQIKIPKENGNHKEFKFTGPAIVKDPASRLVLHQFQGSTSKSKHPFKKRKLDESHQSEYAQYLGLQPAVKFKCGKCCCSSFESLGMLKQHQRFCSPAPIPPVSSPTPAPASSTAPNTNFRITRKVYLCSACGTYYENWNLFLHIREVHNRHTCLFCFGMFSQAQKLASHLVVKHNIQEDYFTSKEDLSSKFSQSFYLLCCKCEKVFTERENFVSHECAQAVKQCSVCKLKGKHSPDCTKISKHKKLSPVADEEFKNSKIVQHSQVDSSPKETESNNLENECVDETLLDSSIEDNNLNTKNEYLDTDQHVYNKPKSKSYINECSDDALCDDSKYKIQKINQLDEFNHNSENTVQTITCIENEISNTNQDPLDIVNSLNNNNALNCFPASNENFTIARKNEDEAPSNKDEIICGSLDLGDESKCSLEKSSTEISSNTTEDKKNDATNSADEKLDDSSNNVNSPSSFDIEMDNSLQPTVSHDPYTSTPILNSSHLSSTSNETMKSVLKPPPRNRRPPKRYQFKSTEENLPIIEPCEIKETVCKVPKLTVKVPKILTEDKESTSDYSSESEDSEKLTVDCDENSEGHVDAEHLGESSKCDNVSKEDEPSPVCEGSDGGDSAKLVEQQHHSTEVDCVAVAGEDIPVTELTLDRPLDRYPLKDLLKVFLSATIYNCIYCNHARKIAVNAKQLSLHFVGQHKFSATVDSITAEELMPETIVTKIKTSLQEVENVFINLEGYESDIKTDMKYYDNTLECFQCFYVTTVHKELYLHNRKMHQKTILLCVMCKSNFYSYSELLCHLCPGTYVLNNEIQFRCCLCQHDTIASAFRLMVHLRKCHHACDVCLETCQNQSKLSNHVWKHKLHHLCYRCGIAYRNKPDITKHLFWKHGTESVLCKKCLQKRWPHVYHFCIPPNSFICEECNLTFTKAVSLKVHKRLHTNDSPYLCTEENCSEKFVSKKLLKKHEMKHLEPPEHLDDPPKQHPMLDEISDVTPSNDNNVESIDAVKDKIESKGTSLKVKKSKKNKKNKDKDNLLIDVNLPALNLSESDSSEESESESMKKSEENVQPVVDQDLEMRLDIPEETKPEPPVIGIWDNFKMYQAQVEKQNESLQTSKPRHVCDSDHDYCVIPTNEEDHSLEHKLGIESPNKESKRKSKNKKKNSKKDSISSSSDSSSDSDSSCSCGSNCSCSSSSGSSRSSSSSSDSESSSTNRQPHKAQQKDSDASVVDIMATEESSLRHNLTEPLELPIAESDLDTDETETDEDFYDEHPQKLANKILAEKRNQLMLLATVAPVNNGTYLDTSRPVTPDNLEDIKEIKKKVKTKKKKKLRKTSSKKQIHNNPILPVTKICIRPEDPPISLPNKITISLQTNSVIDKNPVISPKLSILSNSDSDNKRASKRRRVPNKFYGYSSDEEYVQKPQLPPKLEWRKEDLPSPSGVQQSSIPDIPNITNILTHESRPVISPKLVIKEPIYSSTDEDSDSSREGVLQINHPFPLDHVEPVNEEIEHHPPPLRIHPPIGSFPFPRPAGARQAREGESVYCYCRCPYDEVSEMIACDGEGCTIEWFHFECVGIMVPPKGKWFCPDCRQKQENAEIFIE